MFRKKGEVHVARTRGEMGLSFLILILILILIRILIRGRRHHTNVQKKSNGDLIICRNVILIYA